MKRPAPTPSRVACALLAASLLLAACGADAGARGTRREDEPVEITVETALAVAYDEAVEVNGTLSPMEQATLAAEVDGRVTSVRADLGDTVGKGAVLASLLDDELRPASEKAEATLAEAERELARTERLAEASMASRAEVEIARTRAEEARAAAAQAAARLSKTTIRAPWPGVVGARYVSVGDYVRTGTALFELVQVDPLRLQASVPDVYADRVGVGLPVEVVVESPTGDDRPIEAALARVGPAVDAASRAFPVEATLENPEGVLKAGSFARVRLVLGLVEGAVGIPARSVQTASGVSHAFEVRDGHAAERPVIVVGAQGDRVVVTGIAAGAAVAVKGAARLGDGSPVRVVDEEAWGRAPTPKASP